MNILTQLNLLVGILLFTTLTYSQTSEFKVDHIGYAEGLSGQLVRSIKVDDFGHLWIATFNELNKYDGFQTKIFDSNNSILGNGSFIDLLKDASGNIWSLQTDSIGLRRFDNSEYMTHAYQISITNPSNDKILSFNEYINTSMLTENNLIWVFQRAENIFLIDSSGTVYKYSDSLHKLFTMDIDSEFVGITNRESYCLVNENNIIQEFNFRHELQYSYDQVKVTSGDVVEIDDGGNLIFLDLSQEYYDGLCLLENGQVDSLPDYNRNTSNPNKNIYKDNYRDLPSNISKDPNGISLIGGLVYFPSIPIDIYTRLGSEYHMISDIEKSSSNTYFIANDIGVSSIKKRENFFKSFKPQSTDINSVRGMLKYDDIIISKSKDNLIYANSPNNKYDVDFLNGKMKYGISYYRDSKNPDQIWVCGYVDKGIQLIDLKHKEIRIPKTIQWKELNGFHRSSITDLLYTYGESGLYKYAGTDLQWNKVDIPTKEGTLTGVNHIIESENKLICATNEGLIVHDEQSKQNEHIQLYKDSVLLKICFIQQDKKEKNILWLGTKHHGLVQHDIKKNKNWIINTDSGLSNNNVHAIMEDDFNRLWISTNKYLNCFDKKDSSIYVYTTEDGLSHEEFNKFSYFKDTTTGEFYFGGLLGFNCFNPMNINLDNKILSKINVTDIRSIKNDGKENLFDSGTIDNDVIKIYDEDVVINFTFTLDDIFNSAERKFYYNIPKLNSKWTTLNSNNLSINKLPYGKYDLEVVANKYSSSTRSEVKKFTLEFVKPFHKTWLFYLSCFLLLSLFTYAVFRFRTQRIRKRNKELEQLVNDRTKELKSVNETKNKILAILSHDLKSPMGGLRDYYEKLDFLLKKDRLLEIQEISRISKLKIQNLEMALDNLLNWALAESNTLKSKAELLSLNFEVKNTLELFDHIIKNNKLKIESNLAILDQVMVDKNIMQTILRNIIHNALKFSYPNGKIEINKIEEDKAFITLSIRDFGIGMNPDIYDPNVLDIDNANHGLGFGLNTSKDLAKIGDIGLEVISKNLQGTQVILKFPKGSAE